MRSLWFEIHPRSPLTGRSCRVGNKLVIAIMGACALLTLPCQGGGSQDGSAAAPPAAAGPLASQLTALDQQMAAYIADMEKTVAQLSTLRDSVEREYAATGDPQLLTRRNQLDERVATMRQAVAEARATREKLSNTVKRP